MGLDVYLYKCKDLKAKQAFDKKKTDADDAIYKALKIDPAFSAAAGGALGAGGSGLTTSGWEEYRRRTSAWYKQNTPPSESIETEVCVDSKKYPEHYFKVGYFRSSYNPSGINSVLRNAIGKDLYWIFFKEENPQDYEVRPDWQGALERARQVLLEYRQFLDENGSVKVIESSAWMGDGQPPASKAEAMAIFKEEMKRHHEAFKDGATHPFASKDENWYSNRSGDFYLGKGAALLAAISGVSEFSGRQRTTYLVIRDQPDEEAVKKYGGDWNLSAIEVVIETIEYVLAQEDSGDYYFHWSS